MICFFWKLLLYSEGLYCANVALSLVLAKDMDNRGGGSSFLCFDVDIEWTSNSHIFLRVRCTKMDLNLSSNRAFPPVIYSVQCGVLILVV